MEDDEDNEHYRHERKMALLKRSIEFETIQFDQIFVQCLMKATVKETKRVNFRDQDQNEETEEEDEHHEHLQIKLTFSQIQDEGVDSNIIPFIY